MYVVVTKTMCCIGYHYDGFVETHAKGHEMQQSHHADNHASCWEGTMFS